MLMLSKLDNSIVCHSDIYEIARALENKELIKCNKDMHVFHTSCFLKKYVQSSGVDCTCDKCGCDCSPYIKIFFKYFLKKVVREKRYYFGPTTIYNMLDEFIDSVSCVKLEKLLWYGLLNKKSIRCLIELINKNKGKDPAFTLLVGNLHYHLFKKMDTDDVFEEFLRHESPSIYFFDEFFTRAKYLATVDPTNKSLIVGQEEHSIDFSSKFKYSLLGFINEISKMIGENIYLDTDIIISILLLFIQSCFDKISSAETKYLIKIIIQGKNIKNNKCTQSNKLVMHDNNMLIYKICNKKYLNLNLCDIMELASIVTVSDELQLLWILKFISINITINISNHNERCEFLKYFSKLSIKYVDDWIEILRYAIEYIDADDITFLQLKEMISIICNERSNDKIKYCPKDPYKYLSFIDSYKCVLNYTKDDLYKLLDIAIDSKAPEVITDIACIIIITRNYNDRGEDLLKLVLPVLSESYLLQFFIYFACRGNAVNINTIGSFISIFDNSEFIYLIEIGIESILEYIINSSDEELLVSLIPYISLDQLNNLEICFAENIINLVVTYIYKCNDKEDCVKNIFKTHSYFNSDNLLDEEKPIVTFLCNKFIELYRELVFEKINYKTISLIVDTLNKNSGISFRFAKLKIYSHNKNH